MRWVVSKDHVHILVSSPLGLVPSEIMRRIKGRSATKLFEEFPHLAGGGGGRLLPAAAVAGGGHYTCRRGLRTISEALRLIGMVF